MGHPLILFILVIKSYLQNMKKIQKSLAGATGQWTFVHIWDLWAIFLTTQKSCVDFSRLCQKLVIIVWLMPQK